ncbi:MAG: hypothetical protein R3A48_13245 [Polyangiales bacterium]
MSRAAKLALVALVGCASRAPAPPRALPTTEPASDVPVAIDVLAAQVDATHEAGPEPPLQGVAAIHLRGSSTCALLADGRVVCGGGDESQWAPPGELDSNLRAPEGVSFVPDMQGVEALCVTTNMLCARLRGGEVRCRGGVARELDSDEGSTRGVSVGAVEGVPPGSALRELDGDCVLTHPDGARRRVALPRGLSDAWLEEPPSSAARDCELRDGAARCAGSNAHGLLANEVTPSFSREAPSSLFGLSGVRDVAFSGRHGCAVLADGSVRCWGRNLSGQIGTGDARSRAIPSAVVGVDDARAVRLNDEMSCAVRASGEVWCWGTSIRGLFGADGVTSRLAPVAIPGLSGVADLALTDSAACALKRDGTVWCWGRDAWSAPGARAPDWQIRRVSIAR